MAAPETNAEALALSALVWTLGEPARAERLLSMTGLSAADLRERAGDPTLLCAVLSFLEAHEPDLIGCATALEVKPLDLVHARGILDS